MRKKTEILRFRTDAETLSALTKLCGDAGQTPSQFLREILVSELAKRGCISDIAAPSLAARDHHGDPSASSQALYSILVDQSSQDRATPENWRRKYHELMRRLAAVFRAVDSLRTIDSVATQPRLSDLHNGADMHI